MTLTNHQGSTVHVYLTVSIDWKFVMAIGIVLLARSLLT